VQFRSPIIAVTAGEPAGIGPELCAHLARRQRDHPWPAQLVVLGDRDLLRERALRIGVEAEWPEFSGGFETGTGTLAVWQHPVAARVTPGKLDAMNAQAVMATLETAAQGCMMGSFSAIVTAPVNKAVINDAGIPFTGHTEFFAERGGVGRVVMMLVGGSVGPAGAPLRVALATTHLPLARVPSAITRDGLESTLRILLHDLGQKFGLPRPRIAVCGLNPHAGESGHLGVEEAHIIGPAIEAARREGALLEGPLPADTVFVPAQLERFDCVLAMYHDQGLPVLKHASFGRGVNVTLGLPFLRTSVDHGTALDLAADAAKARDADPGSLFAAVDLAVDLARRAAR
jgi:4-hydroxythreonine-4-phosphate dehydrogenase